MFNELAASIPPKIQELILSSDENGCGDNVNQGGRLS